MLFEYDKGAEIVVARVDRLIHPAYVASRELRKCAANLNMIATEFPKRLLRNGLRLINGSRPYCLEQNLERWPDGLFHLVDRDYQNWRNLKIALSAEELATIGIDRWAKSRAVAVGFADSIMPLSDDVLWNRPTRWKVANLAGLIQALGRHVAKSIP